MLDKIFVDQDFQKEKMISVFSTDFRNFFSVLKIKEIHETGLRSSNPSYLSFHFSEIKCRMLMFESTVLTRNQFSICEDL